MNATTCCGHQNRILDLTDLAELLKISERHLHNLRKDDPGFPAPRMCGNLPRWDESTVFAWIASPAAASGEAPATAADRESEPYVPTPPPAPAAARRGRRAPRV